MTSVISAELDEKDAELVSASRQGDRQAFGRIVRRYQGMISGLIYAICGDLQRSEDLAQDTFLSAWKSLSGLREPAKLPAWLCQIARRRAQDVLRKSSCERIAVREYSLRALHPAETPDQAIIHQEEMSTVWRALAEIPNPYRETLVMYYRLGRSAEQVAAAMETSEESVRQRLTRGREMLRGQVGAMIERNLESSAPRPAFTLAVMAALPAITPMATAAGVGTAVKGSVAANSGWLAFFAMWLGMIGGLGGGLAGSWAALKDDRTPTERRLTIRFLIKIWLVAAMLIPASFALFHFHGREGWSDLTFMSLISLLYMLAWGTIATVVERYYARSQRVRDSRPPTKAGVGTCISIAVGTSIGGLGWMIHLAMIAGDRLGAGIIAVVIVLLASVVARTIRYSTRSSMLVLTAGYAIAIVAMLNWRLDGWVAVFRGLNPANVNLPIWIVDICAAVLVGWVVTVTRMESRPTVTHGGTT